jgi:tetratricopeptide (TPR) repeat protein
VRQARLRAGLSLAQVAGRELSRQAIHLIEHGRVRPRLRTMQIIARRLHVPISSLLAKPALDADLRQIYFADLERLSQKQQYTAVAERAQALLDDGVRGEFEAVSSFHLGRALAHLNRPEEAVEHLQRARQLFESLKDPWLAAESMEWEAGALYLLEDPRAVPLAELALERYRALEPRQADIEARMLEHLGTFLVRHRDYARARDFYEESLQVAGGVRDLSRLARVYHGLARCHWSLGARKRAVELCSRAVALYAVEHELRPASARADLPRVENDLAKMYMDEGRLDRAEELVTSSLDHMAEAGVERGRSAPLLTLGELRQRQGRLDEAMALAHEAIELTTRLAEQMRLASAYQLLGELHAARGDHTLVDASFARALEILDGAGLVHRGAECRSAYQDLLDARQGTSRRQA